MSNDYQREGSLPMRVNDQDANRLQSDALIDPSRIVFVGQRRDRSSVSVDVVVDGARRALPLRLEIRNHSPTGFEWGYPGSGPAQLALAICAEMIGPDGAERVYQQVKEKLLVPIAANDWTLCGNDVFAAIVAASTAGDRDRQALKERATGRQAKE